MSQPLPPMKIDFEASLAENVTHVESLQFLLAWPLESIRKTVRRLPVFRDIPIGCKNRQCEYFARCPLTQEERDFVEGKLCPVEIDYAMHVFAGYCEDLGVTPDQFTDLHMVADIARIHVMLRRIDLHLAMEGMKSQGFGGIMQKIPEPIFVEVEHVLLQAQTRLRKDLDIKHEKLLASREAKSKQAERMTRMNSDWSSIMSKVNEVFTATHPPHHGLIAAQSTDIEGDFTVEEPPASS